MVNSHLISTGYGNHMLSTVQKMYNKQKQKEGKDIKKEGSTGKMRRSKSSISNRAGTVKPIKIIDNKIVRNP